MTRSLLHTIAPLTVASVMILGTSACPTKPQPAPPPPVLDGGTCASACANLKALGCPEADADPPCETVCAKVQAFEMTDLRLACLTAARTKAEARACKSVKCP